MCIFCCWCKPLHKWKKSEGRKSLTLTTTARRWNKKKQGKPLAHLALPSCLLLVSGCGGTLYTHTWASRRKLYNDSWVRSLLKDLPDSIKVVGALPLVCVFVCVEEGCLYVSVWVGGTCLCFFHFAWKQCLKKGIHSRPNECPGKMRSLTLYKQDAWSRLFCTISVQLNSSTENQIQWAFLYGR